MARWLYVYYRVAEAALPAVMGQVQQMQAGLTRAHPGLQATLLRRPETHDGDVTLMEAYVGGVNPALQALIAQAAAELPQPRHSELFDDLPAPPG